MNEIKNLELKISKFLRYGVIFAGVIIFIGWISLINLTENPFFNFQQYDHISLQDLLNYHIYHKNWGVLISYTGLGVLISLPLIRVSLTAIIFFKQKEYILALIAVTVLVGLALSMILGYEF